MPLKLNKDRKFEIDDRFSFPLIFFFNFHIILFLIICFILSTTCSEVKLSEKELIIWEIKLREDYEKAAKLFRSLASMSADCECLV